MNVIKQIVERKYNAIRHLNWFRKTVDTVAAPIVIMDKRLLLSGVYFESRKKWKLHLSDKVDHAVVTTEDTGYLVSVLKYPNQNKDSYVEVLVSRGHEMYSRFDATISVLNLAGEQQEVAGVGECFTEGAYHVVLTSAEHAKLLEG